MPLTQEQVWTVADELEAQGTAPTLVALRKALGGGSYSTISEAMAERRSRQKYLHDSDVPLPQAVGEKLSTLGRHVWAAALASASDRLEADRQQFDRARVQLEAEREQALELANHATSELEAAQLRIEALEATNDTSRHANDELRTKLAACNERLAAANAQVSESAQRVDDLNRELERVHETNVTLISTLADRGSQIDGQTAPARGRTRHNKTGKERQ